MENKDYQAIISVETSLSDAFNSIANRVDDWWAKNFEGSSDKSRESFTVRFDPTYMTFKVTEFIQNEKIEWTVTDCLLHWINDKKEWVGTRITWGFEQKGNLVEITMTHISLVPEAECYKDCSAGWNGHIKKSLYKLLAEGVGNPE